MALKFISENGQQRQLNRMAQAIALNQNHTGNKKYTHTPLLTTPARGQWNFSYFLWILFSILGLGFGELSCRVSHQCHVLALLEHQLALVVFLKT